MDEKKNIIILPWSTGKEFLEDGMEDGNDVDEDEKRAILKNLQLRELLELVVPEAKIDRTDWKEIYNKIPHKILEELNISSIDDLLIFLGVRRGVLSPENIREYTDSLILEWRDQKRKDQESYTRDGIHTIPILWWLGNFFNVYIKTLSHDDNCRIINTLAYEWIPLDISQLCEHLEDFGKIPETAFLHIARTQPHAIFSHYKKFEKYPFPMQIFGEAARYIDVGEIDGLCRENGISDQIKRQILNFKASFERITKKLIGREIKLTTEYYPTDVQKHEQLAIRDPSLSYLVLSSWERNEELHSIIEVPYLNLSKKSPHLPQLQNMNPEEKENFLINLSAVISRNLYYQQLMANRDTINAELKRIVGYWDKYAEMPIFKERHVVIAAHIENHSDIDINTYWIKEKNRFWKTALSERIKNDGGIVSEILRPKEDTIESLNETKKDILTAIQETPPPFTFIFDGHGGPDAIYFSGGEKIDLSTCSAEEVENAKKITLIEFFEVYKSRIVNFWIQNNDIFINDGCYSANFIREFFVMCEQSKIPKPIFIGQSEYGQLWFSEYRSDYGGELFDRIFDWGSPHATVWNIIQNDMKVKNTNPSIYIPDESWKTMQLTSRPVEEWETIAT